MADEQEEKKAEENKSQIANANINNGISGTNEGIPPVDDHQGLIAKATEAAERIEKANKEMDALLRKQELLQAEQRLQGRTYAGQATHEETPDEKWAREAKIRYAGTGMDPTA